MRYDLVLFRSLELAPLLASSKLTGLWLPQYCLPIVPVKVDPRLTSGLSDACGCTPSHRCRRHREVQRGWLLEAPSASRWMSTRHVAANAAYSFVLDQLFVASLQVARSFGAVHDDRRRYDEELAARGNISRWPYYAFWSHFHWAVHIELVVVGEMRTHVEFLDMLHLRDFNLARRWWTGAICDVRVEPRSSALEEAASLRRPPQGVYVNQQPARHPRGTSAVPSVAALQCPESFQRGWRVACPWGSPACMRSARANETARRVDALMRSAKRRIKGHEQPFKCFSP